MQNAQNPKKSVKGFKDISHYFLSAAEADASPDATGTAGHLEDSNSRAASNEAPVSPDKPTKPARRKDNCSACAHLIARAGQPFQCRIFSVEYARHGVEQKEKIHISEGHTCPYFMRVTSKQIEDILRNHKSALEPEQVREYAHKVDKKTTDIKTITVSPLPGQRAEEVLREELMRYLMDGYSIAEATVMKKQGSEESKHSKTIIDKVRLRIEEKT